MRTSISIALLAAATLATPLAAAEHIVNGGFEALGFGGTGGYYNVGTLSTGFGGPDHAIPSDFGFAVPVNNVDIIRNGVYTASLASGGNYNLDLVGYGATGAISQTFATHAGSLYTVSFDYTENGGGKTADVLVDNVSIGSVAGTGSWQTFTGSFIGTGAPVTFAISELAGGGNGGVVLDNISVTGAVPEPATWGLMLAGFVMVGVAARSRKRAIAA